MEYVIEFDTRPQLVGPFHSEREAETAARTISEQRGGDQWRIRPMTLPPFALA
ncbi:hypothetical protein WDJ51_08260 [Rathayibacter sp. YIM 133350]|uniref:hypothetical protein n=1 Tax=Rathayibacter sp. YIM 133350 TaxID=3131992 RepID=UPI00307D1B68